MLLYSKIFKNRCLNMTLAFKLVTCVLVISTFDNSSTIPIFSREQQNAVVGTSKHVSSNPEEDLDNILRFRRQDPIVQPVWTSDQGQGDSDQDYNVRITDEKLEQTEAIRDFIHHIVENGSFAVDLDKGDFKEDGMVPESESKAELEADAEAFEAFEFAERASKTEAIQEPGLSLEPETLIEIDLTPFVPEVKPMQELEPVEERGHSLEPETVIEIDLTPVVPEVKPLPELKPMQVFKNAPPSIIPNISSKKSKKIESVDSPFLTWIKKTFRNPWGTI